MFEIRTRTSGTEERYSINKPVELKPPLIDLEAQKWVTGGKDDKDIIQPERLNEVARKGCDSLNTGNN